MIIAVDASGGEYAPHEIVKGAIKAAQDFKIGIALVGKKEILHVQARRHMKNLDITLIDAPEVIEDAESPIEAVTKKQNSSIVVGINMVKEGKASAFVSAGSTGAVMYAAFAMLGRVEGIERPALGLLYPVSGETKDSHIVVGIIGFSRANVEILNRAQQLLIFSSAGLLAVILLLIGLSYRWLIGGPLNLIIETIDESQKEQYIKRIPIARRDEWGQLALHFNLMADEIQQVMARNFDLTRHLEDRVREETLKVVQLQKQVDDLKQLTALGHLTANLAHDLGTPLHSIGGLAKLLLEREGWPPDVVRKLELIVQQTQRLDNVIQNVRKATRLPDPHFEVLTLQNILNETLPLIEPLTKQSNVVVGVYIDTAIKSLYVDRSRIQTALLNIIQNSLEAMPKGGKITISAESVEQNRAVAIKIQDTGAGIPSDMIDKACEPFFSTRKNEGLRGLGLAIVRDIIKTHGGKMEITSPPGKGTSIILYLPVADKPEQKL